MNTPQTVVVDLQSTWFIEDLMPNAAGQERIMEAVTEFGETFDTSKDASLWYSLIVEEAFEFYEEYVAFGITPNLMKEYADLMYVCAGFKRVQGNGFYNIPDIDQYDSLTQVIYMAQDVMLALFTTSTLMEAFELVHESNMSKLDKDGNVLRNEAGKVMKSDQYRRPEMNNLFNKDDMLNNMKIRLGA